MMITFGEYLRNMNKFAEMHPESLDYQVIYSHDDEGNEYQRVLTNTPSLVQLEDPNQKSYRNLEVLGFDCEDDINIEDCNAVIIN